jgi:osmoprotectant transport system permease protein
MNFFSEVWAWFTTVDNWTGSAGIINRTLEHVQLSLITVIIAAAVAVPIAAALANKGRGGLLAVSAVNIGRALPSFGIVAIALPFTIWLAKRVPFIESGLGAWPTFIALFLLALPPMFTNTYTGIAEADADIVEAGRGMGMQDGEILRSIKFPLASPLILTGIRISAVQVVATATLGAFVAWGGLGRYILDGFRQRDNVQLFAGALLVAALSILTEVLFGFIERRVVPRGLRDRAGMPEAVTEFSK